MINSMRWLILALCLLGPIGCAQTEPIKPITFAPMQLPDGTTVGGANWKTTGWLNSSQTVALFQCSANKSECKPLSAGTLSGSGYADLLASAIHGSLGAVGGVLLMPKQPGSGGGVFLNAPDISTAVNTQILQR